MKVDGSGKSSQIKGTSKAGAKKGADGASFSGMLDETSETQEKQAVSGPAAVGGIDALLAMQEQGGGAQEGEKRAKKRALMMLDELEKVRVDLLSGGVPQSRLEQLAHMVSNQRDTVMDPKLAAVLDEVDLRVQVELAKFSMK